jgi:single-strand DNA-binding protein
MAAGKGAAPAVDPCHRGGGRVVVNKIIVIGNLGQDPELRYTPTGQMITSFSVASNHKYKDSNGQQREATEWFNCSAFGKLAETCNNYLTKGQQVYVEGRLSSRTYQTKGGEIRQSLDIRVSDVQFLGKRDGYRDAPVGIDAADSRVIGEEPGTDDIEMPF